MSLLQVIWRAILSALAVLADAIARLVRIEQKADDSSSKLNAAILEANQKVLDAVAALSAKADQIIANEETLAAGQNEVLSRCAKIIDILTVPQTAEVAGIRITIEDENMAAKVRASGVDFQLLDSGKALATIGFVDAAGLSTTVATGATVATSWTSSDPGVVVVGRVDGLNADVSPATPPVLVTGAVVSASTTITNTDGTTIGPLTANGDPIDVVAGGPAGMSIAESAE